jgi:SsrA-binding protein
MAKNSQNAKSPVARDLIKNRQARHLYEVIEKFEAGIELKGSEVKALREGGGSIKEAYVQPKGEELFICGMMIPPYSNGSAFQEPSTRDRRLLLHRREIDKLRGSVTAKGMTIVPLRLYVNDRSLIKIEVALCRGKAAHDKRADIKERTMKRELEREYKVR